MHIKYIVRSHVHWRVEPHHWAAAVALNHAAMTTHSYLSATELSHFKSGIIRDEKQVACATLNHFEIGIGVVISIEKIGIKYVGNEIVILSMLLRRPSTTTLTSHSVLEP